MQETKPAMTTVCPISGQTRREEIINSLTHGLGAALSLIALSVLVTTASLSQNIWHVFSSAIFGVSLILLYLASTLYHSAKDHKRKRKLKVFDHACIYILIAGSYTPFMLGPLQGPTGWTIFTVIWILAIAGVAFKLFFTGRFRIFSTLMYIGMGWIVILVITPLAAAMPREGLNGMIAGGACYMVGTIFYLGRKIPYHHGLWHLSCLAGSAFHFFTVLFYVVV